MSFFQRLAALAAIARAKFLTLTLVCLLVAACYSAQSVALELELLVRVLLVAFSAHISVNAFNEYFDHRSGLDGMTQRTEFSGGSGTLGRHPELAKAALWLALGSLAMVIGVGLSLTLEFGSELIWLGLLGCVLIYFYTNYFNRFAWLCWAAPGLGFGICMVVGAIWVFQGFIDAGAWAIGSYVGLLVSNLLLLNQFPDIEADRQVGRKHLAIRYSFPFARGVWLFGYIIAADLLMTAVWFGWLPAVALSALLPLLLLVPISRRLWQLRQPVATPGQWGAVLGVQVTLIHLSLLVLALALVLS